MDGHKDGILIILLIVLSGLVLMMNKDMLEVKLKGNGLEMSIK